MAPTSTFNTYLTQLPQWQNSILECVYMYHNAFTTVEIFSQDCEIYATSDGSAPNFSGSFGWSMETSKDKKIATNKGPAGGYRCLSYRAEAYSLLSLVLFITHIHRYMAKKNTSDLQTVFRLSKCNRQGEQITILYQFLY